VRSTFLKSLNHVKLQFEEIIEPFMLNAYLLNFVHLLIILKVMCGKMKWDLTRTFQLLLLCMDLGDSVLFELKRRSCLLMSIFPLRP